MLDREIELSSDLEWMLQSGQAGREALARALTDEFGGSFERLARAWTGAPEAECRAMVVRAVAAALTEVHRYRAGSGAPAWFYGAALADWLRIDSPALSAISDEMPMPDEDLLQGGLKRLGGRDRLTGLLAWVCRLTPAGIAAVLKEPPPRIQERLAGGREAIRRSGWPPAAGEATPAELDEHIVHGLEAVWPDPGWSEAEREAIAGQAVRVASGQTQNRRRSSRVSETFTTILGMALIGGLIWLLNNGLPLPATRPGPTRIVTQIVTKLVEITATPREVVVIAPTLTPMPPPAQPFYVIQPGDSLVSIARRLNVQPDTLRDFNRLAPGAPLPPGLKLWAPAAFTKGYAAARPSLPTSTPFPTPTQAPKSSDEILTFIDTAPRRFASLWADLLAIDYGPIGYAGPPRTSRVQIWNGRGRSLALMGPINANPDEALIRQSQNYFVYWPTEERSSFTLLRYPTAEASVYSYLSQFTSPGRWLRGLADPLTYRSTGADNLAGRPVWIMEAVNRAGRVTWQLWLDQATGMILRRRQMGIDGKTIVREVTAVAVQYNAELPIQELMDPTVPWRGGFAADASGKPIPVGAALATSGRGDAPARTPAAARQPPKGYNPAFAQLTFQYTEAVRLPNQSLFPVTVIANSYTLGRVGMGDPWKMICTRSPDGKKLAFVSQPEISLPGNGRLFWFDLSDYAGPGGMAISSPLGDVHVTRLAFSPDGRSLAAFGYEDQFSVGSVYRLDLTSGAVQVIASAPNVSSLAWSADGKTLIFLEANNIGIERVRALRLNGEELQPPVDVPVQGAIGVLDNSWSRRLWGIDFQVPTGGLEACVQPPVRN
jgi:LysM repeat protein